MKRYLMTAGVAFALALAPATVFAQTGGGTAGGAPGASRMNNDTKNCAGAGCVNPGPAAGGKSTNGHVSAGTTAEGGIADMTKNCAGAGCANPAPDDENSAELPSDQAKTPAPNASDK